jgi:hypothetical protein
MELYQLLNLHKNQASEIAAAIALMSQTRKLWLGALSDLCKLPLREMAESLHQGLPDTKAGVSVLGLSWHQPLSSPQRTRVVARILPHPPFTLSATLSRVGNLFLNCGQMLPSQSLSLQKPWHLFGRGVKIPPVFLLLLFICFVSQNPSS